MKDTLKKALMAAARAALQAGCEIIAQELKVDPHAPAIPGSATAGSKKKTAKTVH